MIACRIGVIAILAVCLAGAGLGPTFALAAKKPPILNTRIAYLGKAYDEPPPLSLVDKVLTDNGIQFTNRKKADKSSFECASGVQFDGNSQVTFDTTGAQPLRVGDQFGGLRVVGLNSGEN